MEKGDIEREQENPSELLETTKEWNRQIEIEHKQERKGSHSNEVEKVYAYHVKRLDMSKMRRTMRERVTRE